MEFPERLATLRRARGLTQAALAEKVGVHHQHLNRYEAGEHQPSMEVIRKLCVALEVSADELVFGSAVPLITDRRLAMCFEGTKILAEKERVLLADVVETFLAAHEHRREGPGSGGPRRRRKV